MAVRSRSHTRSAIPRDLDRDDRWQRRPRIEHRASWSASANWRPPDGRELAFRGKPRTGRTSTLCAPRAPTCGRDVTTLGRAGGNEACRIRHGHQTGPASPSQRRSDRPELLISPGTGGRLHILGWNRGGHGCVDVAQPLHRGHGPSWSPDGRHVVVQRFQSASPPGWPCSRRMVDPITTSIFTAGVPAERLACRALAGWQIHHRVLRLHRRGGRVAR